MAAQVSFSQPVRGRAAKQKVSFNFHKTRVANEDIQSRFSEIVFPMRRISGVSQPPFFFMDASANAPIVTQFDDSSHTHAARSHLQTHPVHRRTPSAHCPPRLASYANRPRVCRVA
jgi:hypothetical protein